VIGLLLARNGSVANLIWVRLSGGIRMLIGRVEMVACLGVTMRHPALLSSRCTRSLNHGLRLGRMCASLLRRGVGLSTVPRRASSRPCRSPWMVRLGWCLGGLERLRRMCLGLSLILG